MKKSYKALAISKCYLLKNQGIYFYSGRAQAES